MSKAARRTRRHRRDAKPAAELPVIEFLKNQLADPDPRSHAEFLSDYRAKQAAGQLKNPAVTGPLLDRMERAIATP